MIRALRGFRRSFGRAIGTVLLGAVALVGLADAQATGTIRAFSVRHQYTGRLSTYLIGNQLLNCNAADAGCSAARNNGGANINNNDYVMEYVDIDADASTFNSSSATLTVPSGATVEAAYLYWGGDTSGNGGANAPTPAANNQVRFKAPGGTYQTLTADTLDATGTRFSGVKDVTALVTAGGTGAYTVANLQAGIGQDRYGGWSLVVIFRDPSQPLRSATVFDGAATVDSGGDITIPVSGFRTPASGAVGARIGLIAFEGDAGYTGDEFLVNGTQIGDAVNPPNAGVPTSNVFNSTNSRLGVAQTGRTPQQSNQFGFDVDYIAVPAGVIANNATSANMTFSAPTEVYYPIGATFVTNVYEPEIVTNFTKTATDLNGGQFRPGDVVEYTINLSNTGDDSSDTTVISDVLPAGLTYVPGSLAVVSGPNAGAKTDVTGDDEADYNAGTRTLTFRVGVGATSAVGGRIFPVPQADSATVVRFRATIDSPQPNGATLSNVAEVDYKGATSGVTGSGTTQPASFNVTSESDVAVAFAGIGATAPAGTALNYTLTVTNNGPEAADATRITYDVPNAIGGVTISCAATNGASCPNTAGLTDLSSLAIPTFPKTGQMVFTITGTAPASGTLNHSATAALPAGRVDPTPANNTANASTVVVQNADLQITNTITGGTPYVAGQDVTYSIVVTNAGPNAATTVTLSDTLPAGTTFVSLASPGGWSATTPAVGATGTINASIASVAANSSATFTLVVRIANGTAGNTVVTDTASVSASPADSDVSNNSASASFTVSDGADLSLSKTLDTAGPYHEGQTIAYTLVVSNAGPATATNVQVTDTPSNLTISGVSGACAALPCTLASLAPGASQTVNVTATITAPGAFDNAATVGATQVDPTPSNNGDSTGNGGNALASADLGVLNVLDSGSPAAAGSQVRYTITVTNNGPSAVANARLVEAMPAQLGNPTWTCASGCAATSGTGDLDTLVTLNAGQSITVSVTGTAPTITPATISGPTATVSAPVSAVDLNPSNDSATASPVTVQALPIDALDDAGSTGGATGGTAIANVLANDTFNAGSAVGNVVLSVVSPASSANVVLNTTTGAVTVAGGTPSATYTIGYRICETANPSNCDNATATVTVTSATLVASNDAGTANGQTGGVPIATVRGNDTVGGTPATSSNGMLTQLSSSNPNVTLDTATGAVNVAAGTPAGTVTLTYRLCETLNPANCTTATVTVTVTAAVIDAVNDNAGPVEGSAGGNAVVNVLGNDTVGATPATGSNVTVTPATNGPLAVDAAGNVNVASNTPAGTYTLNYQICEVLNPTNCDTALVSVVVSAAPIAANDDAPPAVNGASGGIAIANVLGNDMLGASIPTLATVTLSRVSSSNPAMTLNTATGAVNVAPGTPAGTYTLVYRICQLLNPTNCDTGTVTVTVSAAPIDALDDASAPVDGGPGAHGVLNVLGNDTLDGATATVSMVTLTQQPGTSPALTLDPATGNVDLAGNTPAGPYTLIYRACEQLNPTNCDVAQVTINVIAPAVAATADTAATRQNTPVVLAVLGNDTLGGSATDATRVVVTIDTAPQHGTATVNADGTVRYTPATNYSGGDVFTYRLCDRVNPTVCATATGSVAITPNTVDAIDETVDTPQAGPVVINPMTRTTNGGGTPLDPGSVRVTAPPTHGTVVVNPDGTLTYTPETLFFGTETFQYRICDLSTPTPVCDVATVTVVVSMQAPQLRITKTAPPRSVHVGDLVRYTLVVENIGIAPSNGTTLLDTPPAGFTYVDGSLGIDDADDQGVLAGTQPIRITGIDVPVGGRATVVYVLRVGAGVGRGAHTNTVSAVDSTGSTVSNTATADVTVEGDSMTDDSLIVGSVFADKNGNGVQDEGERGIPGVRIASVEGLVIETDPMGRYHLEGVDVGGNARGRNFALKVDVATLPPGSEFTTENPRVRRVTPGLPVRFDFGVRLPPVPDNDTQAGSGEGTR